MKNSISTRIDLIIRELGHNKNSFSKAIGLNNNVTIGRIINEDRKPSYDVIEKIILTFGSIDANWLITGDGDMIKTNNKYNQASEVLKVKETQIEDLKLHIKTLMIQVEEQNKLLNDCNAEKKHIYRLLKKSDLLNGP